MAMVLALIVSGIGLLVCVYAVGYFSHPKPGIGRLAGLLTLFAGAMLGIAVSDDLLTLFVFWELTSVTSYLLIGNDDKNPHARAAALSAILITGLGGLVMLAGFVLIGQAAGTYRLSELVAAPPSGTTVTVGVVLVLIGAFTKSAQVPFGGWLPGAMVAPTPISTYLHAATMVKAGVFLVARLAPVLVSVDTWRPVVLTVASVTMIVGAWRALRQHDLKLLLAYGTVSQLGFLMLLFGTGEYAVAQAGIVLLIAHALFKAALFMVVGIIDHEVGTRDVRRLAGFGPGWRAGHHHRRHRRGLDGGCSARVWASSPRRRRSTGCSTHRSRDERRSSSWSSSDRSSRSHTHLGSCSGCSAAWRFPNADEPSVSPTAHAPSRSFVAPAALLAAASLVIGLAPVIISGLVKAATNALYPEATPKSVVLWAGFNTALLLSVDDHRPRCRHGGRSAACRGRRSDDSIG